MKEVVKELVKGLFPFYLTLFIIIILLIIVLLIWKNKRKKDYGNCPKCGNKLLIKKGKYGLFIGCSSYPSCDYTKKLDKKI